MLVLSRKLNQAVKIGAGVVVTILEITHDRVRLGIAAPRDVRVLRDELISHDAPETPAAPAHRFVNSPRVHARRRPAAEGE